MIIRFIAAISFLFFAGTALSQRKLSQAEQREISHAAKENDSELFVITGDGVKHTGLKMKVDNSFPPMFIKLDDVKYTRKTDGFLAYQTEDKYTVHIPHIGDAPRYLKGKINLYEYLFTERSEIYLRWCLEKEKGVFKIATFENLEDLLGDNPEVMEKYREFFPNIKNKTDYFSSMWLQQQDKYSDHVLELVRMYNR